MLDADALVVRGERARILRQSLLPRSATSIPPSNFTSISSQRRNWRNTQRQHGSVCTQSSRRLSRHRFNALEWCCTSTHGANKSYLALLVLGVLGHVGIALVL